MKPTQEQTNTTEPTEDIGAIVATLKVLGATVRERRWNDADETVEVFAERFAHPYDHCASGFKFTFKHGRLTSLHARAYADYDHWWNVSESPSYNRSIAFHESVNESIRQALCENDTGHKVQ